MASPGPSSLHPRPPVPPAARRPGRGWLELQRATHRTRFEVALTAGGAIALVFSVALTTMHPVALAVALVTGSLALIAIARIVGLVPALTAAVFAPVVVALTDPVWSQRGRGSFSVGGSAAKTFAIFTACALLGAYLRRRQRRSLLSSYPGRRRG